MCDSCYNGLLEDDDKVWVVLRSCQIYGQPISPREKLAKFELGELQGRELPSRNRHIPVIYCGDLMHNAPEMAKAGKDVLTVGFLIRQISAGRIGAASAALAISLTNGSAGGDRENWWIFGVTAALLAIKETHKAVVY
jgi:hypothetical protein